MCADTGSRPSQTWRTFLKSHLKQTVSMDFFTVPTATFRVLFVFIVLSHDRRRIVHFNVTEHPTEDWTAQQIREAFPWDEAPRHLIRDRDAIFGNDIVATTKAMDHRRSGDRAAVTLAESVCGAANRIDSPGVPGSHDRMEPEIVVSDSAQLFSLL